MINAVGNAELCCVYKGPVVPLQSLHRIVTTIKLMSLFLRTAQASCKTQQARCCFFVTMKGVALIIPEALLAQKWEKNYRIRCGFPF